MTQLKMSGKKCIDEDAENLTKPRYKKAIIYIHNAI
jgi:hypothetical protein